MPTPKEWQENLERIQSFSRGTAEKEALTEEDIEELSDIIGDDAATVALAKLMSSVGELASKLVYLMSVAPEENKIDVAEGFITGLIISIVAILASSPSGQEGNEQ